MARENAGYLAVNTISIDETEALLGHDYMTLFVDLDHRQIIMLSKGKTARQCQLLLPIELCTNLQVHKDDTN
jgi:hypothetical protein